MGPAIPCRHVLRSLTIASHPICHIRYIRCGPSQLQYKLIIRVNGIDRNVEQLRCFYKQLIYDVDIVAYILGRLFGTNLFTVNA